MDLTLYVFSTSYEHGAGEWFSFHRAIRR